MNNTNKNIIFIACGGTGGHLFPAISIGNKLESMGLKIIYIGSKFGIEKKYYAKKNINAELLDIKGIQRNLSLKSIINNLYFPIRFIKSYIYSIKLIKKYKPLAIVGTGGYSSGMPLLAGIKMKTTTVIQEQNSVPGLVTRILHKKVDFTFVAYNYTKKILDNKNVTLAGNPIRQDLLSIDKISARKKLGLNKHKKTIFILGGSQGSVPLNNHILKNIKFYIKNDYQIYFQCGYKQYSELSSKLKNYDNIILKTFIDDMSSAYSASDLIISRAGALAISEICFMGKAMILIPYKFAANNHQKINAEEIKNEKACILINQDELNTGKLEANINELFNNKDKLAQLEENAINISNKNSVDIISNKIKEIAYE